MAGFLPAQLLILLTKYPNIHRSLSVCLLLTCSHSLDSLLSIQSWGKGLENCRASLFQKHGTFVPLQPTFPYLTLPNKGFPSPLVKNKNYKKGKNYYSDNLIYPKQVNKNNTKVLEAELCFLAQRHILRVQLSPGCCSSPATFPEGFKVPCSSQSLTVNSPVLSVP